MPTTPTDDDLIAAYVAVWDDTPGNPLTRASVVKSCRDMLAAPTLEAAADVTGWWLEEPTDPEEWSRHTALVATFRRRLRAEADPEAEIEAALNRASATLADLAEQLNTIAALCRREKQ